MSFKARTISLFERLPKVSFYARTRGWYFLLAWSHRISGTLLVILVSFHILLFLPKRGGGSAGFSFLWWILAIPLIFHALNGGRIILYESYGRRDEARMLRWVAGLSVIYLSILGLLIWVPDQVVSPFFYWLVVLTAALILAYMVGGRVWRPAHSLFWRFQRVSAAFLILTVPAYMLFIPLSSPASGESGLLLMGAEGVFVRLVYLLILLGALYHGGYGIWSLASDYLPGGMLRWTVALMVTLIMMVLGWLGTGKILII